MSVLRAGIAFDDFGPSARAIDKEPIVVIPSSREDLRQDEYAHDQYDYAACINCLHRQSAVADGLHSDRFDSASHSKRLCRTPASLALSKDWTTGDSSQSQ
jgi:hypothetical protein